MLIHHNPTHLVTFRDGTSLKVTILEDRTRKDPWGRTGSMRVLVDNPGGNGQSERFIAFGDNDAIGIKPM